MVLNRTRGQGGQPLTFCWWVWWRRACVECDLCREAPYCWRLALRARLSPFHTWSFPHLRSENDAGRRRIILATARRRCHHLRTSSAAATAHRSITIIGGPQPRSQCRPRSCSRRRGIAKVRPAARSAKRKCRAAVTGGRLWRGVPEQPRQPPDARRRRTAQPFHARRRTGPVGGEFHSRLGR
jgi:hypothetical protein